jgi:putative endonuclease
VNLNGKSAEQLAAAYLQQNGLKLLESNYHCRFGEIDLVMRDGKEIVFVEVRLRTNARFGGAGESITPAKQRKLALTANHYLMQHGVAPCRFDAVLLESLATTNLRWLKNAFDSTWN